VLNPVANVPAIVIASAGVGHLGTATATGKASSLPEPRAYPNPMKSSTTFDYMLSQRGSVKITLYNLAGVKVAEVLNMELPAGPHSTTYTNSSLKPGMYFYVVKAAGQSYTRKLMVE
jgi:hypothetical protein